MLDAAERLGAEGALGAGFSLVEFDDLVLGNGPMPLPILEQVSLELDRGDAVAIMAGDP